MKTLYIYSQDSNDFNNHRLKVLLMQDGENLFSLIRFDQSWQIDKVLQSNFESNQLKNLIVVGIAVDHETRAKEYLPWEDIYLNPPEPEPIGRKYPRFLIDEVMPNVVKFLNLSPDDIDWGIGGSSYGALISLYCNLHVPIFDFLLLESPSLYVSNQRILALTKEKIHNLPDHIYIGVGTNEIGLDDCDEQHEDNLLAVDDVKSLAMTIMNLRSSIHLSLVIDVCGKHSVHDWKRRFFTAISSWI